MVDEPLTGLESSIGHSLARRVDNLATRVQGSPDGARLRDLASALDGGPSASTWRALSPLQAFDASSLAEQSIRAPRRAAWFTWIDTIRNALIFLPVLVTWIAVASAVAAYRALVVAKPDAVQLPFLYLWENGFDSQFPLTLSRLAIIDAIIITILVLLTLASSVLQDIAFRQEDERLQGSAEEIRATLADAAFALAEALPYGAADTIQRLDEVGRAILTDLRDDRALVRETAQLQAKQTSELLTATLQLGKLGDDLGVVVQGLVQIVPRLDTYLQTIAASEQAIQMSEVQLRDTIQRLTANVTELLAEQTRTIGTAMISLTTSAQGTVIMAERLDQLVSAVLDRQRALLDELVLERTNQSQLFGLLSGTLQEFDRTLAHAATYSRLMYGVTADVRDLSNVLPTMARSVKEQLDSLVDNQLKASVALTQAAMRIDAQSSGTADRGDDRDLGTGNSKR